MLQNRTDYTENLTKRQIEALPYLLRPGPITDQARHAGIARSTLYRWLDDDDFRKCLERLRQEALRFSQSELQAMSYKAVDAVNDAFESDDLRVRLQAARLLMAESRNAQYDQAMKDRLENLDDAVHILQDPSWLPQ